MTTIASGHGIATISKGTTLDVWFPAPALSALTGSAPAELVALVGEDKARAVTRELVSIEIDISKAPSDAADAYLRLHLLSHRLVKPHGLVLDGVFGILSNVVWTSVGPCAVDGFEITRARLKAAHGHVSVYGVDKFPRMVDYVIPSGVRIADADRVRLGAHLASVQQ
jgi:2,3,4,5-tetrahydropyridine-2-carboxylate N-succinyltransferase